MNSLSDYVVYLGRFKGAEVYQGVEIYLCVTCGCPVLEPTGSTKIRESHKKFHEREGHTLLVIQK